MIQSSYDVLMKYPIRKTKKQKEAFRNDIMTFCEKFGYHVTVEQGSRGCHNIVIGNSDSADYLVTAHYDTPARLLIPNFATPTNAFVSIGKLVLTILIFGIFGYFGGYLTGTGHLWGSLLFLIPCCYPLMIIYGPANKNNYNDNTSGVITVLEMMQKIPENCRSKVCFVLFDLEEAGLIGAAAYRKAHKEQTDRQIVLNLDCVGDGDELVLFPMKSVRKKTEIIVGLSTICGRYGNKTISVHKEGFVNYPSDQKKFPNGVGIAALHRNKRVGLYFGRIHTDRDTILEQTNINVLSAALISLICCSGMIRKEQ